MSAIFDKDPKEQEIVQAIVDNEERADVFLAMSDFQIKYETRATERAIATQLYAMEVSKPEPVNMPKPDYEQIAKDCVARARETAPYLLQELNSVPTSVRQEEE